MISLQNVSKTFDDGRITAVEGLSLYVDQGEFLALVGESGCGKTTTLKMINRLIEPTAGTIIVNDEDIMAVNPVELRRHIGYVFQEIGLFPHMSIAENIGIVPALLGWTQQEIETRTSELLEMVGLEADTFSHRSPAALSGGQRQRVGVARALAAHPRVMLMDEPFGALDPITRATLQDEFRSLQGKLGLTVVMVTHDMMEALLLGDRIAVMERGSIVAQGTPRDLLSDPGHPYAAALLDGPRRHAEQLHDIAAGKSNAGGAGQS